MAIDYYVPQPHWFDLALTKCVDDIGDHEALLKAVGEHG